MDAEQIAKRYATLKANRSEWETHWQDVGDYILPRKSDVITTEQPGAKKTEKMFDATAPMAAEKLAGFLQANLTPRERQWFDLRAKGAEDDGEVRDWLYRAREKIHDAFAASNFYVHVNEAMIDLITFGTACLMSEEAPIRAPGFNGFTFRTVHIGEYVVDENAQELIDTVIREVKMTARQAAQMFADDNLPAEIRDKAADPARAHERVTFWHALYPRSDEETRKGGAKRLPIASVWAVDKPRQIVRESGFYEMPAHVGRWTKLSRELYGRSPAMRALPDVKTLNLIVQYGLEALPLALYPPYLIKEGSIEGGRLKQTPGAQNHWDGNDELSRPQQMEWRGNVALEQRMLEMYRAIVDRAFYVDEIRLKESPQMTATEVIDRRETRLVNLLPMAARVESELLDPLIERAFMTMFRADAFGPAPAALAGAGPVSIEYTAPLARAQRLTQLKAFNEGMSIFAPYLEIRPDLLDNVNLDAALQESMVVLGVPPDFLNRPAQVAEVRGQRAAQMAQQQQMAEVAAMADVGSKAAQSVAAARQ